MSLTAGSLPPQRPDQQTPSSDAGVAPGASSGITRARLVIVSGSGIVGFFEYEGTPAAGNPPVAYAIPPGVTQDPYGNPLPFASGGFTSSQPGAEFSALSAGGVLIGLVNVAAGIVSSVNASIVISGSSAGQGLTISSGVGPEVGGVATQLAIADGGGGGPNTGGVTIASSDGNQYDTERLILYSTGAPQIVNGTAQVVIAGLSLTLEKGTYDFEAIINCQALTANQIFTTMAGGVTVSAFYANITYVGPAVTGAAISAFQSALGTNTGLDYPVASSSGSPVVKSMIHGRVIVTAAGTFQVNAATNSAANNWQVLAGSKLIIRPVLVT